MLKPKFSTDQGNYKIQFKTPPFQKHPDKGEDWFKKKNQFLGEKLNRIQTVFIL